MEADDSKQEIIEGTTSSTKIENIISEVDALESSIDETAEKLKNLTTNLEKFLKAEKSDDTQQNVENNQKTSNENETNDESNEKNQTDILDCDGLLDLLRSIQVDTDDRLCIGLVGYPNVGKSSTINCLMGAKKVFKTL